MKMHPLNQNPGTTGITDDDFSVQTSVTHWVTDAKEIRPGIFRDENGDLWVTAATATAAPIWAGENAKDRVNHKNQTLA